MVDALNYLAFLERNYSTNFFKHMQPSDHNGVYSSFCRFLRSKIAIVKTGLNKDCYKGLHLDWQVT